MPRKKNNRKKIQAAKKAAQNLAAKKKPPVAMIAHGNSRFLAAAMALSASLESSGE